MIRYTLKRISFGILTVFFIATATFFAMHFVPGDPLLNAKATTPEIREQLLAHYGLDKPLAVQYVRFLENTLRGDFGMSFTQQNRRVNDIIRDHFPISAVLGLFAVFLAAVGGIGFGALAAIRKDSWIDRTLMFLVILGVSVPSFVFAGLSQFAVTEVNIFFNESILPVGGWDWDNLATMVLPGIVLGIGTLAFLTRLMRSSMLEVINLDYIRTAKSKGLSPLRVFWSHEMRNAIIPVVTFLGPAIAFITTGGFVVESVFAIPGLGRYFIQAIQQLDYTVIMGLTIFYGAYLVFFIIAVDLIYGLIDPRIKVAAK